MNEEEERIVRLLIALLGDSGNHLAPQVDVARVAHQRFPGSLSFDLVVPSEEPPRSAYGSPGPWPDAVVYAADGHATGALRLYVNGQVLAGVEYDWYTDEMPTGYPPSDSVRVMKNT
jgi:hypothetical protein